MKVPKEPDPEELVRLMDTMEAKIQLRAYEDNVGTAYEVLGRLQEEIDDILRSQTLHRVWRERRPNLVRMVDELENVLV